MIAVGLDPVVAFWFAVVLFATSAIASGLCVVYRARRRRARIHKLERLPVWRNASSGVLIGADRLQFGAAPPGASTASRIVRWAAAQGAGVVVFETVSELTASSELARDTYVWAVYAPSFTHLIALSRSYESTSAVRAITDEWGEVISYLERTGVQRVAVVGVYDPLSTPELTADDAESMAAAVIRMNDRIVELAAENGVAFLRTAEMFAQRSGEFTRAPQGHFELNNIGHVIQTGLIQNWLIELDDQNGRSQGVSPESLFSLATGIPAAHATRARSR